MPCQSQPVSAVARRARRPRSPRTLPADHDEGHLEARRRPRRTESLLPRSIDNFASGTAVSRIVIEIHLISGDANTLLQEAQRVSSAAGYVSGDRVLMSGVHVMCSMGILTAGNGIGILMLAPA